MAAGVTHRGGPHTGRVPEHALSAPEAAHSHDDCLDTVDERTDQGSPVHEVGGWDGHGIGPTGQRVGWIRNGEWLVSKHGVILGRARIDSNQIRSDSRSDGEGQTGGHLDSQIDVATHRHPTVVQ